jgi:hypothetical protein
MKTRIVLLALIAALAFTGCKKDDPVTPPDAYAEFKANAAPRWENGSTIEPSDASAGTFIIDTGGNLFESAKYKTGRILSPDGSDYEFIEFSGAATAGKPTEPTIRKPSGIAPLHSLEILKVDGSKLWIVFKETATGTERRMVQ